jgi:acetylornithine deacetylase/succinyl-diaminopimelate desuccinylase-like protein
MNGKPLTYLDTAATSQKPQSVLDAMDRYYETSNANVHRAAYSLAEAATNALEGARAKVARFIGAGSANEVVFTKNATESLNLVAHAWGSEFLSRGDVVVLSQLEHHANIVPWHQLSATKGIELRWIPVGDDGRLDLGDFGRAALEGGDVMPIGNKTVLIGLSERSTSRMIEQIAKALFEKGAAERVIAWNTLEVLAYRTGNPDHPINAIPPSAKAHLHMRFVVGTDVSRLREHVVAHLHHHGWLRELGRSGQVLYQPGAL